MIRVQTSPCCCTAEGRPPSDTGSIRFDSGALCRGKLTATRMQGGKERLQKYLPVVEARMQDGRKYIAGDEFTAAGVHD